MWTKQQMKDQRGKIILITGANTGIGYETALALCEAGAHVIMACRNLEKAKQAQSEIEAKKGKGSIEIAELNLASLDSVSAFSKKFIAGR